MDAETRKMPEPIIEPATMVVESKRPSEEGGSAAGRAEAEGSIGGLGGVAQSGGLGSGDGFGRAHRSALWWRPYT